MSILQTVRAWLGHDKAATRGQGSEVRGQEVWERIPDEQVRHVWKRAEDDDCGEDDDPGEGDDIVVVSPIWYEENGTPFCDYCGQDMVYSHTEILERIMVATNRYDSKGALLLNCENCRWNFEVRYRHHLRVPCHKCDNTSHWREIRKGGA